MARGGNACGRAVVCLNDALIALYTESRDPLWQGLAPGAAPPQPRDEVPQWLPPPGVHNSFQTRIRACLRPPCGWWTAEIGVQQKSVSKKVSNQHLQTHNFVFICFSGFWVHADMVLWANKWICCAICCTGTLYAFPSQHNPQKSITDLYIAAAKWDETLHKRNPDELFRQFQAN